MNWKKCKYPIHSPSWETIPLWNNVKNNLKTGDIILSHGCKVIQSYFIRKFSGCDATHASMIVRDGDKIKLLDFSDYLKCPKIYDRVEDFLDQYENSVFTLAPLPVNDNITWTEKDTARYTNPAISFSRWCYLFPCPKNKRICSSLIGDIYKEKGIELIGLNNNNYTPCDFFRRSGNNNIVFRYDKK